MTGRPRGWRVFEPLKDVAEFAELRTDLKLGTVVCPNGADLAPEFLYEQVQKARARSAVVLSVSAAVPGAE